MRIDLAVRTNHARCHGGVRKDLILREATVLSLTCGDDALSNRCRTICFRSSLAAQLAKLHSGHVNVNVDAIEEWARNATNVALDLSLRTAALARRVIPKTTRARVF